MLGLNTETPQVFWNGTKVDGITSIMVRNDDDEHSVVFKMAEEPIVTELRAAGISVKRV